VAGEDGLEERSEDDLSTIGLGKGHPEDSDELEGVVEGEPVDSIHSRLEDSQECIDNPVCEPLSIVDGARREQSVQGVVCRDDKAESVDKELSSDVEEDEEEVQGADTEDDVDLGYAGLALEVVEKLVLSELLIELGDVLLGAILDRHVVGGEGEDGWKLVLILI